MKRTILITGAAGFIGSSAAKFFLSEGYRVIGLDNFDPFYSRPIKETNINDLFEYTDFKFIEHSILDIASLDFQEKIDLVIHLAAKAGVRPSITDPESYIETNVRGTQAVLNYCVERNIKKIIFGSSSSVYGNSTEVPFVESQCTDLPISPYAASKQAAELFCKVSHSLFGLDIICLRFFTVYGPKQRPDLAIHKFFNLIYQGEKIDLYGNTDSARDYTYIDDIVNGIALSVDYLFKNDVVFEILNIGNEYPVRLSDLVDNIARVANKPVLINHMQKQKGDVEITFANIEKAKNLIGYTPKVTFNDGLELFKIWFERNYIA